MCIIFSNPCACLPDVLLLLLMVNTAASRAFYIYLSLKCFKQPPRDLRNYIAVFKKDTRIIIWRRPLILPVQRKKKTSCNITLFCVVLRAWD